MSENLGLLVLLRYVAIEHASTDFVDNRDRWIAAS